MNFQKITGAEAVFHSDANFLLVKIKNAKRIYEQLCEKGIIVRDRSKVVLCDDCLRITIGTPNENRQLLEALNNL
jgi:histidinol-phosphate aminotransferase